MKAAIRQALVLALLAIVPAGGALGWHLLRPGAGAPTPVVASAVAGWQPQPLFVDARTEAEFAAGHLPGAVRLTESEWEILFDGFLDAWEPGTRIVVYCSGSGCASSREVASRLQRELGFPHVSYLLGGIEEWK